MGCVSTVSPASADTGRGCESCGEALAGRRPQARFCSSTCRRRSSALRRGCPRCVGKLTIDSAALNLPALDDAVTLASVADLATMGVARVRAARQALSRLVRRLEGAPEPAGRSDEPNEVARAERQPVGDPAQHQGRFLAQVRRCGGFACVVRSVPRGAGRRRAGDRQSDGMTSPADHPRVRLVARTLEAALDARAEFAEVRRNITDALGPLEDAVALVACAPLDAVGVDPVQQASRGLRRLAVQIEGHGGQDG
jgi:hypothetical protein